MTKQRKISQKEVLAMFSEQFARYMPAGWYYSVYFSEKHIFINNPSSRSPYAFMTAQVEYAYCRAIFRVSLPVLKDSSLEYTKESVLHEVMHVVAHPGIDMLTHKRVQEGTEYLTSMLANIVLQERRRIAIEARKKRAEKLSTPIAVKSMEKTRKKKYE